MIRIFMPVGKPAVTWLCGLLLCLLTLSAQAQPSLRIGVYDNPPKLFLDEEGQLSGILGDLLNAIAALEQWQLIVVPCTWNECLTLLETRAIDLMPDVPISAS